MRTAVLKSLRNKESETTDKGVERASEILDAASRLFAEAGYAGLSMRGVAATLGITLGTVQHYYQTKEALFEAMLTHIVERMQVDADQLAGAAEGASPAQRFKEAMRFFIDSVQSPTGASTFTELKALARRDRFAAEVMEQIMVRARKSIGRRIRELDPSVSDKQLNARSALVLAQLMGLTFYDAGAKKRRRPDLAGIDEASIELMLAIAEGKG